MLSNRLGSWLGPGANPWREKDLVLIKKRNGKKKEEKCSHEMIGPLSQKFGMQVHILAW
jgi:hypothetical protein